jgi:catechol 2,3-dioxygenase-like lactoylglutathione lyase family enzyme
VQASLDHAHIFSSDLAATLGFFVDLLGAQIVWDEEAAGTRTVRLGLGSSFLHVYDQPPKGERGGAVHHLGVATDDLLALVESMKQKGYVFRNAIHDEPKFRYVMVAAPDGLLVELFQSKEPRRWQLPPEVFPDATS